MEASEAQKRVINLGKQIVDELNDGDKRNILPRWIANYIAEKINLAETSKGKEKEKYQKECFELILKLWSKRSYFPNDKKPFENYDLIFKALAEIDLDNHTHYLFSSPSKEEIKELDLEQNDKSIKLFLAAAQNFDQTFRVFIKHTFEFASYLAMTENVRKYLENAPNKHDDEIRCIVKFNSEIETSEIDEQIKKCRRYIEILKKFSVHSVQLIKFYDEKIKELKEN